DHAPLPAGRLRPGARRSQGWPPGARRVHDGDLSAERANAFSAGEQTTMGRFGYHVIDADGHGGDPREWHARIPAEFRPQWDARRERVKKQFANLPGVGIKQTRGTAKLDSLERPGMSDPTARLADMDLEGIDQTVMFPGGAGEEWAGLDRG